MVTDKCPNGLIGLNPIGPNGLIGLNPTGPIGLIGPNPNGLNGPIGPNRHSRPCTLLSTTKFVVRMANHPDQPSASAVLRA